MISSKRARVAKEICRGWRWNKGSTKRTASLTIIHRQRSSLTFHVLTKGMKTAQASMETNTIERTPRTSRPTLAKKNQQRPKTCPSPWKGSPPKAPIRQDSRSRASSTSVSGKNSPSSRSNRWSWLRICKSLWRRWAWKKCKTYIGISSSCQQWIQGRTAMALASWPSI